MIKTYCEKGHQFFTMKFVCEKSKDILYLRRMLQKAKDSVNSPIEEIFFDSLVKQINLSLAVSTVLTKIDNGYAVVLHEEVNNPSDEQFADEFHKSLGGKSLHGQVPQTAKTEVMEEALVRGVLTKVKGKPSGCDNCKNTTRYIVQACSTATNKPLQWTRPFKCKGKAISYMKVCNEQLPVISNRYYRVSPVL